MYAKLTRKTCSRCKRFKLLKEFSKDKKGRLGLSPRCRKCVKETRDKEYFQRHWKEYSKRPEIAKKLTERDIAYNLKRKFGMTLQDYEDIKIAQNNKCAICPNERSKNGKRLAVDHCHESGKIRGLLCNECNTAIGLLREDIQLLKNCIEYLENSKK